MDPKAAEELLRHKVLRLLRRKELLSQGRLELLLSWRHSGFSIHSQVRLAAGDTKALEAVVRYIMRPAVSPASPPASSGPSPLLPESGGP